MAPILLITKPEKDYELIDSGEGEKLERYGAVVVARPDPQALWKKALPAAEWKKADAVFVPGSGDESKWVTASGIPEKWPISFAGLTLYIKPSSFKHTGIFPEQAENWKWIREIIAAEQGRRPEKISILNLFGYTGGATLAAAQAGAAVVHVDGSKTAITWARENAALSGLEDKPVRWILDDALTFLKREAKRGHRYDGIIMDPPAFGRGPKGEVWKIEEHFVPLLDTAREVLSDKPLFVLVNGYAAGYSAIGYQHALEDLMKGKGGSIEAGEIGIEDKQGRVLPAGIVARWSSRE